MTLTSSWDVSEAMAVFYLELEGMGFVNDTPPTPDEWSHPDGMQVRISHVARTTLVRYRATPPPPPEPIHSVEGKIKYDKGFLWSHLDARQDTSLEEFTAFLLRASRTIQTQLRMKQSQSRF